MLLNAKISSDKMFDIMYTEGAIASSVCVSVRASAPNTFSEFINLSI